MAYHSPAEAQQHSPSLYDKRHILSGRAFFFFRSSELKRLRARQTPNMSWLLVFLSSSSSLSAFVFFNWRSSTASVR